eukprot:SAG11_NODE_3631_length_2323_cov_4.233363_1_plen_174_part_00
MSSSSSSLELEKYSAINNRRSSLLFAIASTLFASSSTLFASSSTLFAISSSSFSLKMSFSQSPILALCVFCTAQHKNEMHTTEETGQGRAKLTCYHDRIIVMTLRLKYVLHLWHLLLKLPQCSDFINDWQIGIRDERTHRWHSKMILSWLVENLNEVKIVMHLLGRPASPTIR